MVIYGYFIFLFLVAFVCLIIGLIKPSIFSKIFRKEMNRKKTSLIFGVVFIVFFILAGITTPPVSQKAVSNKTMAPTNTTATVASATPKTDQQKLEDNLKGNVSKYNSMDGNTDFDFNWGTKVSYKGLQVEKADSNRPAGTKMITVSVNVDKFLQKDYLLKGTGLLSSMLFQTVFNSNMNAYDVIVWFYGKTTDRYGNEKDDVILTYGMDKNTYSKMSWQGFDPTGLCDFLKQEDNLTGNNMNTACNVLVNIQ